MWKLKTDQNSIATQINATYGFEQEGFSTLLTNRNNIKDNNSADISKEQVEQLEHMNAREGCKRNRPERRNPLSIFNENAHLNSGLYNICEANKAKYGLNMSISGLMNRCWAWPSCVLPSFRGGQGTWQTTSLPGVQSDSAEITERQIQGAISAILFYWLANSSIPSSWPIPSPIYTI